MSGPGKNHGNEERIDQQKTSEPFAEQVSFFVEPGTKMKISLDVGAEIVDGNVPPQVLQVKALLQLAPNVNWVWNQTSRSRKKP